MKWTRAHAFGSWVSSRFRASVPTLLAALEDKDADVRNVARARLDG